MNTKRIIYETSDGFPFTYVDVDDDAALTIKFNELAFVIITNHSHRIRLEILRLKAIGKMCTFNIKFICGIVCKNVDSNIALDTLESMVDMCQNRASEGVVDLKKLRK